MNEQPTPRLRGAPQILTINNSSPNISDGTDGPHWNEAERTELKALITSRLPFEDFLYSRGNVSGSQQYFQVSGEPILDQSGHYSGYRGIGTDVTELLRRH